MRCISIVFIINFITIPLLYASPYTTHEIHALLTHAFTIHEHGAFDEACTILKSLYDLGVRNATIESKLMLHALRTQDWSALQMYGVEPYWWYDYDITGKTIFIKYDGGFGDAFMFIRYVKHLHAAGAYVIVQTVPALLPLFSRLPFIDQCVPYNTHVPADYTFRISTPHMALTMHASLEHLAEDVPYIYPDENLVTYWAEQIAADTNIRVGVCWCSGYLYNARTGENKPGPRSIPLVWFEQLCYIPGCTLYSLVKGHGQYDLYTHPLPIKTFSDFDETHGCFMDTAALMKNLDLVITVDTSIAHLAGALGVPVWVLLPANSDFRWFLHCTDSPWYPTMRLFRQQKIGEWQQVMHEIYQALQELTVTKKNREVS
jgi:hypothetical protein